MTTFPLRRLPTRALAAALLAAVVLALPAMARAEVRLLPLGPASDEQFVATELEHAQFEVRLTATQIAERIFQLRNQAQNLHDIGLAIPQVRTTYTSVLNRLNVAIQMRDDINRIARLFWSDARSLEVSLTQLRARYANAY